MLFWVVALTLTAATGAYLLRVLARGRTEPAVNSDIAVYRDQLAEVERDLGRGVIDTAEAEAARIEISRRILDADRAGTGRAKPGTAVTRGNALVATAAVVLALGASVPLYRLIGAPGYPDLPMSARLARAADLMAERPTQAEAEAELARTPAEPVDPAYARLMDDLRKAVAARPDDLTGQRLLARNEAKLGNYAAAAVAQRDVLRLEGAGAAADDHAILADNLILAAGGIVTAEAEAAITGALARDPANPTARFYAGLLWAQTGRPDLAFRYWRDLLEEGPESAPWIAPIRAQIDLLAEAAGVEYSPPPVAGTGPDAGDVAAAAGMAPADRQAMIEGMVEGLAARLASEGGPSEDWARLITSLGVLGQTDRARAIWTEAQGVFKDSPADLGAIDAAARDAGINP